MKVCSDILVNVTRRLTVILMAAGWIMMSCSKEDDVEVLQPQRHWVERKIAVVAPMSESSFMKDRLQHTAEWFLNNFHEAQMGDTLAIDLKLEWHDELNEDMSALSDELSEREDILAVVGPFRNESVAEFAPACQRTQMPLIAPTATSEDIIRRYAVASAGTKKNEHPFLWSLTESDVTFMETMMGTYAALNQYFYELEESFGVGVLAPDNVYGRTFTNWSTFFANEEDVELTDNLTYNGSDNLVDRLVQLLDNIKGGYSYQTIFCVVETAQQMCDVARKRRQWITSNLESFIAYRDIDPEDPRLDMLWEEFVRYYSTYFAFTGLYEEELNSMGDTGRSLLQGYEGFSPYADPSTGFELSYEDKYGVKPSFMECKLYDALLLATFACVYDAYFGDADYSSLTKRHSAFNKAIIAVAMPKDETFGGSVWNVANMYSYLNLLTQGKPTKFKGASGSISFDNDTYTAATHTTYVQWKIMDGKILHNYYYGGEGARANDSQAAWRYFYDQKKAEKAFDDQAEEGSYISYPELTDRYAVLVQGSHGMSNYRHQADVLSVYNMLRRGGFDDDHIILVIDDQLKNDPNNTQPGVVRRSMDGENLYEGAVVDYDNANLSATDLTDILLGNESERTPVVLPRDDGHNVLLYWSGHGRSNAHGGVNDFVWRDMEAGSGFSDEMMRETISEMRAQNTFRKLFLIAEPCYSENIINAIKGIKGVLAMSGASGEEQSWAENWNGGLGRFGTWMCDRFTMNVVNCLTENPSSSYRDLFLYCTRNTIGSHVKIVNSANFENLYNNSPREFF